MTTATNVLLVVAVLAYVVYRQSQWRPVDPARMWKLPIVLGIVGVLQFAELLHDVDTFTIAVLVVEGVLAIVVGAWMGALSQFSRDEAGRLLARTGGAGSALWLVLIVGRVALDVVASGLGAKSLMSAGVILVLLALNRVGRVAVIERRSASFELARAH